MDTKHEPPLTEDELDRMLQDPDVHKAILQGLRALREGRMVPWSKVKKELGLDEALRKDRQDD